MVADVRVKGAEHFAEAGRAIRAAGKEARVEFRKALNRSTRPLKDDVKAHAVATLPRRGGLAKRVAGARFSTRYSLGGERVGVRIEVAAGRKSVDVDQIDRGQVRHPTFGHRPWVGQPVRPGWFSDPFDRSADDVARELLAAVDEVARKFAQ